MYAATSQIDNSDPFKSIECYCDSDYASDLDKRHSTSGYAVLFHGGAISWYSKRQSVVAQSSTEAEYIALCKAAKEIVWIRRLINEITSFTFSTTSTVPAPISNADSTSLSTTSSKSTRNTTPIVVRIDNQSAMKLASNPVNHQQSKHIDVMYHFTRKALKDRIITLLYTPTTENVADILTKPLSRRLIEKHRFGLGIVIASLSG
jgi:enoyl reductase-like protein